MEIDRPIAIAVIVFIIILLMYFFVVPKYFEFKQIQINFSKAQAEYNGKFAYYSEVSRIFTEIENRKDSFEKIDNALPAKSHLADLMYFLQQKGTEAGLIVKSITLTKVGAKTPDNQIKDISFSVDILGTYTSLKNFLSILENSSRLFEVGNIAFGSQITSPAPVVQGKTTPTKAQDVYSLKLEVKTQSY